MKHEALKALVEMARKKMATDDADPVAPAPEAPTNTTVEEILGEPKEAPEGVETEEGGPADVGELLSFLKARTVPAPTSKMAAASSSPTKAKKSHLFKKK